MSPRLFLFALSTCFCTVISVSGVLSAPTESDLLVPSFIHDADHQTDESTLEIQHQLQILNFYAGPLDGIEGPQTRNAIRRFQNWLELPSREFSPADRLLLRLSAALRARHGEGKDLLAMLDEAIEASATFHETRVKLQFYQVDLDHEMSKLQRSFAILSRLLAQDDSYLREVSITFSAVLRDIGNYNQARGLLASILSIHRPLLGDQHPDIHTAMLISAQVEQAIGNNDQAMRILLELLTLVDNHYGPTHNQRRTVIKELGEVAYDRGHFSQSISFYKQAATSDVSDERMYPLSRAAQIHLELGELKEAEEIARTVYDLASNQPEDIPARALAAFLLAEVLSRRRDLKNAEKLFESGLKVVQSGANNDWPDYVLAQSFVRMAIILSYQGRHLEAIHWAQTAYEEGRTQLLPTSRQLRFRQKVLAEVLFRSGDLRAAIFQFTTLLESYAQSSASTSMGSGRLEHRWIELYFEAQHKLQRLEGSNLAGTAFAALSIWMRGPLDVSIKELLRRKSIEDDLQLSALSELQGIREKLHSVVSVTPGKVGIDATGSAGRLLRTQVQTDLDRYLSLVESVRHAIPFSSDELFPQLISAEDAVASLSEGEEILTLAVGQASTFVWHVTAESIEWRAIPISAERLSRKISSLRSGLDPGAPERSVEPARCALQSTAEYLSGHDFDLCLSHELFNQLFGDFDLSDAQHLYFVPDGPLETLPLSVLVTGFDAKGYPIWLSEIVPISVVPSISGLLSSTTVVAETAGIDGGYLGIAPVEFTGHTSGSPLLTVPSSIPGTLDEVQSFSKHLELIPSSLVFGERATERFLEQTDLSKYSVVTFATHGVTAEELGTGTGGRIFEPALILYGGGDGADGILTASEIARLKLSADLVILSGCNTAAPQRPGAEGLSGLARAFFISGAKTLLVSHWGVHDDAARLLTSYTANASKDGKGWAQSLREAMLILENNPASMHPFFWAPFEIVGQIRARQGQRSPPSDIDGDLDFGTAFLDISNRKPPVRGLIVHNQQTASGRTQEP